MKKILILILSLLNFLLPLEAADLVTILVCDSYAENIENAVLSDLKNMRTEARRIVQHTGLNLREVIFTDQEATSNNFISNLKQIPISQEDVVICYFSGHGYRTESKEGNPWPNLFFTLDRRGVDFNRVTLLLLKKEPRLLISLADCCNNYMPEGTAPPVYEGDLPVEANSRVVSNYRQLFLNTSGLIMVSSSALGEFSWCIPRGALFTLALIESLKIETQKTAPGEASWQTVMDRASFIVRERQSPMVVIEN